MDLGSGGGVPGLALALALRRSNWVLLDGSATRSTLLAEAVRRLGMDDRVTVIGVRAEDAGRGPLRGSFDGVLARSFAAPAVTAECAAPFLRLGGILVVAEPPGEPLGGRWDPDGLAFLGLRTELRSQAGTAWQSFRQVAPCPSRYPRRVGVPAKRPLF
jgi:16S rRNA (guanine527-N7)-methyltransferase